MFRKSMCFCAFIVGLSVSVAMAAPTVRQLAGSTKSTGNGTTMEQVRRANGGTRLGGLNTNRAHSTSVVTPSVESASETQSAGARTPVANIMNTTRLKGLTGNKTGTTTNQTTGSTTVTETEISAITNRIDELESRVESQSNDMVKDTTISVPGTYVTDVSVDGNKIDVKKTRLLLAPVRTSDSDTITGDAEIWIVD